MNPRARPDPWMYKTVEVHVWLDEVSACGEREYYSISEMDVFGDEVRCVGSANSLATARERGRRLAASLGVPCIEFARADGQATGRWEPEPGGDDPDGGGP